MIVLGIQAIVCARLWRRMQVDDLSWSVALDRFRRGGSPVIATEVLMRTEDSATFKARYRSYLEAIIARRSHNNVS